MNMCKTTLVGAIALVGATNFAHASTNHQVNYQIIWQQVALNISRNGSYTRTVSRIVQPITPSGVEQVAHMQIAYPANYATVKILAAYTETPTHKRINVAPSAIFTQSTNSAIQAPFLSKGTIKSLIFPSVTPGSTIHIKYAEHFNKAYMPGIYAVSAVLAPSILAKSVSVSVTAPSSMPLYYHARGPWTEHRITGKGTKTIRASGSWSHVDFPPQNTAAITHYAPMVVIGTAANWQAIAHAYHQLAATSIQVTPVIRKTALQAAKGTHGKLAVARLYRWMQQNIQSVNVDYLEAGYRPPKASTTLERGIGDSNANVALLCSLLHADGITAVPALISTSPRYVPYPGADPFAFEHMLVYVPAYRLYLDTSERYAGINGLPLMDAGKPVLVTESSHTLTRTPSPQRKQVQYRDVMQMTLNANGVIKGTSQLTVKGWRAIAMREDVLGDRSGERLQHYIQNGYYQGGRTGSIRIASISKRDALNMPLRMKLRWRNSDAMIPGQRMALILPTPNGISDALTSFVSQASRHYPSVINPETVDEVIHLHLPTGIQPEELPHNQHLNTPIGNYSVSYHYIAGRFDEERRLQLTRFVVGAKEYPALHQLALMAVSTARRGLLLQQK